MTTQSTRRAWNANDPMGKAKAYAKAERELGVERWAYITIAIRKAPHAKDIILRDYDLPEQMLERWRWVLQWRLAKCKCAHPREIVCMSYHIYDKRTQQSLGFNSLLACATAQKAWITRIQNSINDYIRTKKSELFFDPDTDEHLQKAYAKLEQKKDNLKKLNDKIQQEVTAYENATIN